MPMEVENTDTTTLRSNFVASNLVAKKSEERSCNKSQTQSKVKSLKELTFEKVCRDRLHSVSSGKPYELINCNNIIAVDDTEPPSNCQRDDLESDDEVEVIDMNFKPVQKLPISNKKRSSDPIEIITIDDSPLSFIDIEEEEIEREQLLREKTKHFTIPCLQSLRHLEKQFKDRVMEVNLKTVQGSNKRKQTSLKHYASYKHKKNLLIELEKWENTLNECSKNEPYISVENKVDNSGPPQDFVYVTENIFNTKVDHLFDPNYLVGCTCERCMPTMCACPSNSSGKFAYDRFGRVQFEPGQPIYECNVKCSCSISCRNRVVQRGRTVRVTIFRTPNKCGWGVKTMDFISKNQFVTEYVGELITSEMAEERGKIYDKVGQTYLFDLDYNEGDCLYTIDAKIYGNISHFINHSCDPNLNVFGVWSDTLDPTLPRIALFAARDIQPGEELTFDYLMTGSDTSPSSSPISRMSPRKTTRMRCKCGAKNCRTYLY